MVLYGSMAASQNCLLNVAVKLPCSLQLPSVFWQPLPPGGNPLPLLNFTASSFDMWPSLWGVCGTPVSRLNCVKIANKPEHVWGKKMAMHSAKPNVAAHTHTHTTNLSPIFCCCCAGLHASSRSVLGTLHGSRAARGLSWDSGHQEPAELTTADVQATQAGWNSQWQRVEATSTSRIDFGWFWAVKYAYRYTAYLYGWTLDCHWVVCDLDLVMPCTTTTSNDPPGCIGAPSDSGTLRD